MTGELIVEWESQTRKWKDIKTSTYNSTSGFYEGVFTFTHDI